MTFDLVLDDLTNPDPNVRQAVTEKCLYFQSPEGFKWDMFINMANSTSSLQQRVFALVSLENLISKYSDRLSSDIIKKLNQSYPFLFGASQFNDPLVRFTGHLCVTFLAKLVSINDLPNYLTSDVLADPTFAATVIGELTYYLVQSEHKDNNFLKKCFPELYRKYILYPLSEEDIGDDSSGYLLYLLAEIHDECPTFASQFVWDADILPIYIRLVSIFWLWHPHDSVIGLFDNLLELQRLPEELLQSMTDYCISDYLDAFAILFIPDSSTTDELFDFAHQCFRSRMMVLFSLIEQNHLYRFDDLLVILSKCLAGPTPSIVIDTAVGLTGLITKFPQIFYEIKLQLVEICISQLSIGASELPNVMFDFYMSISMFNSSIIDLVKAIYETDDGDKVAKEIFSFIPSCLSDKNILSPLSKILNGILKCKKAKKSEVIKSNSLALTVHLLSTINSCDITVQAKICDLLTKLLPFMELKQDDATNFFDALLDLLLNHRPGCYSAFGKYFQTFSKTNEKLITFPISLLKSVPTRNPAYMYVSELLERFDRSVSIDPYVGVIMQLKWFSEEFNPSNPGFLRRANIEVQEALEKCSKLDIGDNNNISEVLGLLLSCAGRIVELSSTNDQTIISQLTFLLTSLANTITQTTKLYPEAALNGIGNLRPPTQINIVTRLYIDRVVVYLAKTLSQYKDETAKEVYSRILRECTTILGQSLENTGDIIKYAVAVCGFTDYCDSESASEFFATALQIEDQKVFRQVVSAIPKQPLSVLKELFMLLLKHNDVSAIDKLADMLHEFFETNNNNSSIFSDLPMFTPQIMEALEKQLTEAKQKKSQRRVIRKSLVLIMSNSPTQ